MFKLIRNASPYWDITVISPDKMSLLDRLEVVLGVSIDTRILRNVEKIEWVDKMEGVSEANITFSKLTLDLANTVGFFKKGAALALHLGYYDMFGIKFEFDEVFRGLVNKINILYEDSGITAILNIIDGGGTIFEKSADRSDLFTGSEITIIGALGSLASYCGLVLAVNITNVKILKEMNLKFQANGPWLYPVSKKIKVGDKYVYRKASPKDIVEYLAKEYGQYWNISDGVLWFGEPPIELQSSLLFSYRSEHKDYLHFKTHLDYHPFEKFEIIEKASATGAAVLESNINMDEKSMDSSSKLDNITPDTKVRWRTPTGILDDATIRANLELANRYLNTTKAKIEGAIGNLKPSGVTVQGSDAESKAAALEGQSIRNSSRIVGAKIIGALGDPLFRAGNTFTFHGLNDHYGTYLATRVTHIVDVGRGYKMNIEAVGGDIDSVKHNPVIQKGLKVNDIVKQTTDGLISDDVRIRIRSATGIFSKKQIAVGITKAQVAAGLGRPL